METGTAEKKAARELVDSWGRVIVPEKLKRAEAGMGFARLVTIGALAVLLGNAAWALALWAFAKLAAAR